MLVGDPLQLPPIKQCNYPSLPDPTPDLFSSLFHCLLRDEKNRPISLESEKPFEDISRCPYLSIFNENHRKLIVEIFQFRSFSSSLCFFLRNE